MSDGVCRYSVHYEKGETGMTKVKKILVGLVGSALVSLGLSSVVSAASVSSHIAGDAAGINIVTANDPIYLTQAGTTRMPNGDHYSHSSHASHVSHHSHYSSRF